MSSHIEPNALAESDRSTKPGSTWASNTVCTPRHYGVGTRPGDKSVAYTAMMDVVLLLISGASGAGKSTVREAIAADLEPEVTAVELRHLDPIPQTPTQEWRQRMAERALQRAIELAEHGWHLLLAGDPVAPGEMLAAPSAPMVDIAMCLLDMSILSGNGCVVVAIPRSCPTCSARMGGTRCSGRGSRTWWATVGESASSTSRR